MGSITAADVATMVSSIQEARGELRLSGLPSPERARWRRTIHAAITQGGRVIGRSTDANAPCVVLLAGLRLGRRVLDR